MKKNKGITLIALIITIIIMLILVAVSVNVLIKSNLIGTAEKTVDKYKTASEEEANDGTIIINGKRYASMTEYTEILDNGGSRIKFNHTVEGRTIKLNVKVIEQSYVEFAEKKLQNKSNKDKIKILSQGLEFWNGYGQAPYKNADEMLNDSPYDSWEQAVNMEENFDQLLIDWGLVYPENFFNEDNDYVVFAKKKLETAKDDAEKQKIFLDGENYYRKENGEEPYKDLTELLTEWNYNSIEELVKGEGFESLDRMLIAFGDINPEKALEIEENNILVLTLPNGEIETIPGNEYYIEYKANNVDKANYTFIAKKGQEEKTLTVKMAVANLPEGTRVTKTTEYKYGDETAIIPAGFTVSGNADEVTIDGGLVIYLIDDKTDEEIKNLKWYGEELENLKKTYDQFVWIPISQIQINNMFICQAKTGSNGNCNITVENSVAKCTVHNSNQMAGRLYATTTGEKYKDSYTEVYTANSGLREPDIVTGSNGTIYDADEKKLSIISMITGDNISYASTTKFKETLQKEYNEIVALIYNAGGYYVGRYETSNFTTSLDPEGKIVAGADRLSCVNWYKAYAKQEMYANNRNISSVKSSMILGTCYDQMLEFVNVTGQYEVNKAGYVGHSASNFKTKPGLTGGIGYSENYSEYITEPYRDYSKNIYDLEGNVVEFTTEALDDSCRVYRGRKCSGWWIYIT